MPLSAARFNFTLAEDLKEAASDERVKSELGSKISRERIGHEVICWHHLLLITVGSFFFLLTKPFVILDELGKIACKTLGHQFFVCIFADRSHDVRQTPCKSNVWHPWFGAILRCIFFPRELQPSSFWQMWLVCPCAYILYSLHLGFRQMFVMQLYLEIL